VTEPQGPTSAPDPAGDARLSVRLLKEAEQLDAAVYAAIATTPTPELDEPMRRLSNAANYSAVWMGTAAILAAFGGRRGRRAALRGLVAIGATSAVVNQAVKPLYARTRPDRLGVGVPEQRHVRMPASTSFPSGHSASGFAFAAAAGREIPELAMPLQFAAAAVAYSRIHTGVHFPGDTLVGSLIGAGIGALVAGTLDR
jgi:membrane-associated phospholipid phosphatase